MKLKSSLAALALCLAPLASHAGVVYQWVATNTETPWDITFEMEFDSRTVANGTYRLDLDYDHAAGYGVRVPRSGLLALRYTFPGLSNPMEYTARDRRGFSFERGLLNLDLHFGADGFLSGSIYANDTNSHIDLASSGNIFTVLDANSDEGMPSAGCALYADLPCQGASGYFQRVASNDVPEPASIALVAAGLLAASRFRRNGG